MNHLDVVICEDAADAITKGFKYAPPIKPVEIATAVVIRKGTVEGNPTVDLLMHDQEGNEYVVMITGALLKSIPC
jgi:hypothetical protein